MGNSCFRPTNRPDDMKIKNAYLEQCVYMLRESVTERNAKITTLEEKMEYLILDKRELFITNMEEKPDTRNNGSKEDQDGGYRCELNPDKEELTPQTLSCLKANYVQLMDAISLSVESVVAYLYQEGIVTDIVKEDILSESRNRFIRTGKVLDIVISQGSRSKAYEALYAATLKSMLWIAADILHPDKAPHDPMDDGDEKDAEEEAVFRTLPASPMGEMKMADFNADLSYNEEYKALSREIERVDSRLDSLSKALEDLKSSRPKKEESQEMSATSAIPERTEDELRQEFDLQVKRVEQRKVPLSFRDYITMTALETMAGMPDGPSFKFLVNYHRGNSRWAEDNRQDEENELHTKGVTTAVHAMLEYVTRCGQCVRYPDDTEFHPVLWIYTGYRNSILAIEQSHLRLLDEVTKMEREAWSWNEIRTCTLVDSLFEMTFIDGNRVRFLTLENINPQVQETIHNIMRR